jgi:hypothetical protein
MNYLSLETLESKLTLPDHLNFPVKVVPMREILGDSYDCGDNRMAVVREDTNYIFQTPTKVYKPNSRQAILNSALDAIESSNINVDSMEVKHTWSNDKAKWQCRIVFPNETVNINPQVGDILQYGIEIADSFDSTWARLIASVSRRLLCLNGMTGNDFTYSSRRKHTVNSSLSSETVRLSNGVTAFYESGDRYRKLKDTPVSDPHLENMFRSSLATYVSNGRKKVSEGTLDLLMNDWDKTKRDMGMGADLWSALNVGTGWAEHTPTTRGGFSEDARRNRSRKVIDMFNSKEWKELENA